jgi:hypothetical protein
MKNYNKTATCFLPAFILGFAIILWPQFGLSQETTTSDSNAVDETQLPVAVEQPAAEQNTWAPYQIILQRNIFSRQRGPIRQRRATRPRRTVVRNPESYHMLKGIVQEDDTFIAFIENTQTNRVLILHEGGSVARGIVKNFTLDSIEYQLEDKTISVSLGRDLEGGQGTISMGRLLQMSATTSTSSTTSDPNAPATETPLSGDEAEILKRLMEQRKQQLGQ